MARQIPRRRTGAGFAVIQALIVFATASIIAAMAISAHAARARESVLRENAKTLELEVKNYLTAGLDADREAADRAGSYDAHSASGVIAQALVSPANGISAYYVNPLSGSHAIVFQPALPPTAAPRRRRSGSPTTSAMPTVRSPRRLRRRACSAARS